MISFRSVSELSSKFDAEEHINYFTKYDFWREKEFEFSISYRSACFVIVDLIIVSTLQF